MARGRSRTLEPVQEREAALAYLCRVDADAVGKEYSLAGSTVRLSIVGRRAPTWNDPLVDFYRQTHNQNRNSNSAHMFLAFQKGVNPEPTGLIDLEREEPVFNLVRDNIYVPATIDILKRTALSEYTARMQPYDCFVSVVFGIHEGAWGIVNSALVSQLQEAYEPNGKLTLEDVFRSVGDEIIDKVRDGGLAWTDLKKGIVHDVLNTLTERERRVIGMRYGLDEYGGAKTFEQVGDDFSVTRERIRQIEAKALRKLKHPMRSKKLKGLIGLATDGDVMAYKTRLEEQERREQEYLREGYKKGEPNPFLERPTDELDVGIRTKYALDNLGVKTLRELCRYSEADLLRTRYFGRKSLREIGDELSGMKLSFGMRIE